jgi:hypothetical protein
MQPAKYLLTLLILPVMLLSYTDFTRNHPLQLKGIVTDLQTGRPVSKVYLYVTQGSEEILTNDKGEFQLKTWQQLPVTLTIEHTDYVKEVIQVSSDTPALKIKIRKK